jgi:aspartyl-tRNA synthetase
MADVEALAAKIDAQGKVVVGLKKAKGDAAEVKAEVDKLLTLKKELTAIAPDHKLAIQDKKKKKDKKAAEPAGPSKKELRKLEREKAALAVTKEKQARLEASADIFGTPPIIQSQKITDRSWTHVKDLTPALSGKTFWVRGRNFTSRSSGKIAFMTLRQGCFTVQATKSVVKGDTEASDKDMIKYMEGITSESIVDIECLCVTPPAPITSVTQGQVELVIQKIFTVSKASPELPFQITDASRSELEEHQDPEKKQVVVGLDMRLNNRVMDLRTPAAQAIMRIRSGVSLMFMKYLDSQGFVGIHTPKLIGGASEGGSSVFNLDYFGKPACLAQSPQLYKQMVAATADFEKVYEVAPVFRAEESNTRRHLCEYTGLDMEMVIHEHYYEVLETLSNMFIHVFDGLNTQFKSELEIISQVYPFEPLKYHKPTFRITFAEGIQLLREAGVTEEQQGSFDDLSTPNEKLLGDIVAAKYGTDFYMMDEYPLNIRPFYTMPHPTDPKLSNSYDIFIRGQEIVSGAQRIHDYDLLLERVKHCHGDENHGGPAPEDIQGYIDAFKYGAYPHGGGGIGLERVVMLFLGLGNIRKASFFPRDPTRIVP